MARFSKPVMSLIAFLLRKFAKFYEYLINCFFSYSIPLTILLHIINYSLKISKVSDLSRGWPEGSLFNSYYTRVSRRTLLHPIDYSTLPLIFTLSCWVLSKEGSSTIFGVFGITRTEINLSLLIRSMAGCLIDIDGIDLGCYKQMFTFPEVFFS